MEKFNTPNGREEVEQMLDWYRPELIPGPAYCVVRAHYATLAAGDYLSPVIDAFSHSLAKWHHGGARPFG